MTDESPTVGVIGPGWIATNFVRGWLACAHPRPGLLVHGVHLIDGVAGVHAPGVALAPSPEYLLDHSDMVLVGVQAADAPGVLQALRGRDSEGRSSVRAISGVKAVVSAAPGLTLGRLRSLLGPVPAVFRVVSSLGQGSKDCVLGLSPEPGTAPDEIARVTGLLACIGVVEVLPEGSLETAGTVADASAGVLAVALEGLEDGAVGMGLPRDTARLFVRQTLLATALLLKGHPGSPADLKDQVASPGGTTIAGLAVLEEQGVRGALMRALEAAAYVTIGKT